MLVESGLAGRRAGECEVGASASEVVAEREVAKYEVLGYSDLEVLSLLHALPGRQSLPWEYPWSSRPVEAEVEGAGLRWGVA